MTQTTLVCNKPTSWTRKVFSHANSRGAVEIYSSGGSSVDHTAISNTLDKQGLYGRLARESYEKYCQAREGKAKMCKKVSGQIQPKLNLWRLWSKTLKWNINAAYHQNTQFPQVNRVVFPHHSVQMFFSRKGNLDNPGRNLVRGCKRFEVDQRFTFQQDDTKHTVRAQFKYKAESKWKYAAKLDNWCWQRLFLKCNWKMF